MRWEGWRYEVEDAGEVMMSMGEVVSSTGDDEFLGNLSVRVQRGDASGTCGRKKTTTGVRTADAPPSE